MTIKMIFPIEPVPKARARVTRSGFAYTPKKTKDYEQTIKNLATVHMHMNGHMLLQRPLTVSIIFTMKKPKKQTYSYPSRGDLDNYAKAVLDALNGTVWKDDSQICSLVLIKTYGKEPSIDIRVEPGIDISVS